MKYHQLKNQLKRNPRKWLITGVAGFIGSNILEELLTLGQEVVGLDNFMTGNITNLEEVNRKVCDKDWSKFTFIQGDICNFDDCKKALKDVDFVLHQAALGSVPRSIERPIETNHANVTGFLNMLEASRLKKVKSFTYAASSSTYGDHPDLPKREDFIGNPLSPYAVTKFVNEIYAKVYATTYGFKSIGLRYFNVFGPRQDPNGAYAAVIPKWIQAMLNSQKVLINGDGSTTRDFCFIENAVQMNLLAAYAGDRYKNKIYNVAVGNRTSLNELFSIIQKALSIRGFNYTNKPIYKDFRIGDVMHSQADISRAMNYLHYMPSHNVEQGIESSIDWYIESLNSKR